LVIRPARNKESAGPILPSDQGDAEVIRINGAEQRVVGTRLGHLGQPGLGRCWRELEVLGVHVAVGTRPPIATQAGQSPIVEDRLAPAHVGA
jgi:hypothetical protein